MRLTVVAGRAWCRKGNKTVRRVLTQAAWAVSHCKAGYLRAFFHRVKARRGWAKVIVATSHKLLVIAFQVLKTNTPSVEVRSDYLDRLSPARTARKLVQRLEALGLQVQTSPMVGSNA